MCLNVKNYHLLQNNKGVTFTFSLNRQNIGSIRERVNVCRGCKMCDFRYVSELQDTS